MQLIPDTGVAVPMVGFFLIVPIMFFIFYVYLHLYLYRMWQVIGKLPSVFHDGTPLDQAISPWLVTAFARFFQKHGVHEPSILGVSQKWVTIAIVWWLVPITILFIWARYLVRHDWTGTMLHSVLLASAVWSALILYRFATAGLRREPTPIQGVRGLISSGTLLVSIGAIVAVFSIGAFEGSRNQVSWNNPSTWVSGALNLVGMPPSPDLSGEKLIGVSLPGVDLRGARLVGAILEGSNFTRANLRRSDLSRTDLNNADLAFANLENATLWKAKVGSTNFANSTLRGALLNGVAGVLTDFRNANLDRAKLNGAVLPKANFSNAKLTKADLSDADLSGANFLRANLSGADFGLAKLDGANLFGTKLEGADLLGAVLDGANLSRAIGLVQEQLDEACGINLIGLPENLTIKPCPQVTPG